MSRPVEAEELVKMAQSVVTEKYRTYEQLASLGGEAFHPPADTIAS
jgi:pyruvate-ferredoxin/flavodoxin oxidoreductase